MFHFLRSHFKFVRELMGEENGSGRDEANGRANAAVQHRVRHRRARLD